MNTQNKWLKHYLANRMYMFLKSTEGITMNGSRAARLGRRPCSTRFAGSVVEGGVTVAVLPAL